MVFPSKNPMPAYRARSSSRISAFALTLSLAIFGSAQAETRDARIAGMGIRKCTEWQQWKEAKNSEARAMTLEWVQGFIAGHNIFARKGAEAASSVVADVKVLLPLLDAYCLRNPGDRLVSAVVEITQSLGGVKVDLAPKAPPPPNPRPENKGKVEL